MVNQNIQGVIPIEGQGFVSRRHGDFKPGEFKRLTNVELHEGAIKNRRNIKSVAGSAAGIAVAPVVNPFGFIGKLRDYTLMVNETKQYAINQNSQIELWAPTQLPTPAEAGSFHKIIGFFRYNNINYWLTLEFRAGVHIKVALWYGNIVVNNDVPSSYGAGYFAGLTRVDIYTTVPADLHFNKFEFQNAFIQGDRLWIVTSVGIYFSKAANFLDFAAPNGGFFKLPDKIINYGMSLRDGIYVLCDDSIHLLTYSSDPNLDSALRKITDNMGGDHGCVYGDVPYFVNQVGIYRINNNFVEKILDNEFDVGIDYYDNKLSAFEDYLILVKNLPINYEKYNGLSTSVRTNLMINPSLETNFTGFTGSDSYMDRTRDNAKAFSSVWSHKTKKKDNNTVVDRRNTFTNPGCEVSTAGWTAQNSTLTKNNANFHSGGSSLRFSVDPGGNTKVTYPVPLAWAADVGGHHIKIGFWRRWTGTVSFFDSYDIEVHLSWLNAAGVEISEVTLASSTIGISPEATWLKYAFTKTAPAGTRGYVLQFIESPNGLSTDVLYFVDDVIVEDDDIRTGPVGVSYFDGSTPDVDGYIYDWEGTVGLSTSTRKGNRPGVPMDGRYLVEYDGLVNSGVLVAGGKNYTIGAALYAEDAAHTIEFEVRQYNVANALLGVNVITAGPGDTIVDQWAYLTAQFTTDPACTYVKFFVRTTEPLLKDQIYYIEAFHVELTEGYQGYFDGDIADSANVTYAWSGAAHASSSTYTITSIARRLFKNGSRFLPKQGGNELGYNVYFINMASGAVHVVDFKDKRGGVNVEGWGSISDIYVNTNKDANGNYNCYFLTTSFVSETTDSYTYNGYVYYMNSYRDTDFFDTAVGNDGLLDRYGPKVEIEIDSYVPDGNEFLVKKFRNFELMALLPNRNFFVAFGFDNTGYRDYQILVPVVNGVPLPESNRPHFPLRMGINQRGRSFSIKLVNELDLLPIDLLDNEVYGNIEISDLRTLWTYTGRAPESKNVV